MTTMSELHSEMSFGQMAENSEKAEALLKQLANRNRLMLLCHLVQREMSVSELSKAINLSQSALSQHLSKLKEQGIVSARKDGQQVFYRLASMEVNAILSTLYLIYCK